MFNFDFDTLICTFKDGTQIAYINSVFDLTSEQKEEIKQHMENITPKQLKANPYKLYLTDMQKQKLMQMHKWVFNGFIIQSLSGQFIETKRTLNKKYNHKDIKFENYLIIELEDRFLQSKDTPSNQRKIDLTRLSVGDSLNHNDSPYHREFSSLSDNVSETKLMVRVDGNDPNKLYTVIKLVYKN